MLLKLTWYSNRTPIWSSDFESDQIRHSNSDLLGSKSFVSPNFLPFSIGKLFNFYLMIICLNVCIFLQPSYFLSSMYLSPLYLGLWTCSSNCVPSTLSYLVMKGCSIAQQILLTSYLLPSEGGFQNACPFHSEEMMAKPVIQQMVFKEIFEEMSHVFIARKFGLHQTQMKNLLLCKNYPLLCHLATFNQIKFSDLKRIYCFCNPTLDCYNEIR